MFNKKNAAKTAVNGPKQLKRGVFESKRSFEKRQEEENKRYKMEEKERRRSLAKTKGKRFAKGLLAVVIVIALASLVVFILNSSSVKKSMTFAGTIPAAQYTSQLTPVLDTDGHYSFTTDGDFKIMQLTDVHIGGGLMSADEDKSAIAAVSSMILAEKPDLVIVTGDISFPVPYISGALNNLACHKIFAEAMDKLGVYWTVTLGNHDSEVYNYYNREQVAEYYASLGLESKCLFTRGPEDITGEGNQIIKVKNSAGVITQLLYLFDSNSYTDGDYLGIAWKYDNIHDDQIEWYENSLNTFKTANGNVMPKSLAFFHIPLEEVQTAWSEYVTNGRADTTNVQYISGFAGEAKADATADKKVSYGPAHENQLFEKMLTLGSTQAIFNGHDHLNNFVIKYKGITFSYGYSIDYLAYAGIDNYGQQRGCTMITLATDGSVAIVHENYYQAKYVLQGFTKETVEMTDPYYK